MLAPPARAATIQPVPAPDAAGRACSFTFQPPPANWPPMRLAAASGDSASAAWARMPKAFRLCSRMFSLTVLRSTRILGALRAMHKDVLMTRKARISKNHQALYTEYKLAAPNTWAQNGPNWLT